MLIDTHAHLTDEKYKDNIDSIIKELDENKVKKVFTVASLSSFIATTVSPFVAVFFLSTIKYANHPIFGYKFLRFFKILVK